MKDLKQNQAYSHKELTEIYKLEMVKFNHTFSLFADLENKVLKYFRHYAPPPDKPHNRFYYQNDIKLRKDLYSS